MYGNITYVRVWEIGERSALNYFPYMAALIVLLQKKCVYFTEYRVIHNGQI